MKPKRTKSLVGLLVGLGMMLLAPLIGLIGATVGMRQAFSALGQNGVGDPNQLSHGVGAVLSSNIAAIGTGIAGLLVFATCLVIYLLAGRDHEASQ